MLNRTLRYRYCQTNSSIRGVRRCVATLNWYLASILCKISCFWGVLVPKNNIFHLPTVLVMEPVLNTPVNRSFNCNIMYFCEKNIVQFVFITSVCSCIDENTALSPPLQCNEETNIKTYHLQSSSLELQFVFVPGSCYYFHHQLLSLQD